MSGGNDDCYLVKLKDNIIELDGEIQEIDLPHYVEGPWLFERNDVCYLVYAAIKRPVGPEQVGNATADKITGPWRCRDFVTRPA